MVELSSAVLTTLIGMLGVVIGAIISNYFNNKIAAKSARRDMIFRKKTEYFEKTVECIEKNIKIYKNSAREAEKNAKKEEINRIIHKLRENRAKFDVMASRLYVNSENMAGKIKKKTSSEKKSPPAKRVAWTRTFTNITFAKELGLSLSDIINSSLRNFIRTREVYFTHTPRMTPELEELLDRVENDLKKRRNLSPRFKTTKQAIDYLDNI